MLHLQKCLDRHFQLQFFCAKGVSSKTLQIDRNMMRLIVALLSAAPMQKCLLQTLILDNFRYLVGRIDRKNRQCLSILPFAIKNTNKMRIVKKIRETN